MGIFFLLTAFVFGQRGVDCRCLVGRLCLLRGRQVTKQTPVHVVGALNGSFACGGCGEGEKGRQWRAGKVHHPSPLNTTTEFLSHRSRDVGDVERTGYDSGTLLV